MPILTGLAIGAAMGGGIAALQKKDILQGALMGGIGGAVGGAFMPAAGALGGAAGGAEGAVASTAGSSGAGFLGGAGEIAAGAAGTGGGSLGAVTPGIVTPGIGSGGIGSFLGANKYALMGGGLGGMMAPGEKPPSPEQGNIREFSFNPGEKNPLFGNPGENYYTGNRGFTEGAVTPVEDYDKANGGIIALAEGGQPGIETQRYSRPVRQVDPAVAAYNAQIMERANQQYNINNRPGPNQVPGSIGYVAPVQKEKKEPVEYTDLINGPKKEKVSMFDDAMYADLDARYNQNMDSGNSGGEKNGGRITQRYNQGGISSLGSYSDGGQLLRGPGDGVSDSIPARIGAKQPARLADGEFVVPARVVSELGNGSTDAGAKQLYAMMNRVQKNRNKTVGKGKVAVDAKSRNLLPA